MKSWAIAAMICLVLVIAAESATGAEPQVQNQSWNQWRGPSRTGAVTGPNLIKAIPGAGVKPVWINNELKDLNDAGWGSPVIADGKCYVFGHKKHKVADGDLPPAKYPWLPPEKRTGMTDEEYEQYEVNRRDEQEQRSKNFVFEEHLFCLDADNGKQLWEFKRDSVYTRFPQSTTPIVVGDRILYLGAGREACCVSTKDGKLLWKTRLPGEFRDEHHDGSFAVAGNIAAIQLGQFFGLELDSGKLAWTVGEPTGGTCHSSPALWQTKDQTCLIVNLPGGNTTCVVADTGKVLWEMKTGGGHASPIVSGDVLITYGSSRKTGLKAFDLSTNPPEEKWHSTAIADSGSTPVVAGDKVFVQGERRMAAFELESGKQLWMGRLDLDNPRYASPVVTGGILLYAFEEVVAFTADGEGDELFTARIDKDGLLASEETFRTTLKMAELEQEDRSKAEKVWRDNFRSAGILRCTTPAVVDGKVYARLSSGVACWNLSGAE